MGVHQWHVQAGYSQLWLTPLRSLVGRGSYSEGCCVMKYGGRTGRSWGWRDEKTLIPPSSCLIKACLTNKQTPDCRCQSLNLIQVGLQSTPASRTATCFFVRAGRPIRCPCLPLADLHDAGSPHDNIYSQATRKTNSWLMTPLIRTRSALHLSLLNSNSFYFTVDSTDATAINSVSTAVDWFVYPFSGW